MSSAVFSTEIGVVIRPAIYPGAGGRVKRLTALQCERRESNPHPLRDRILSPARLPVSPRSRVLPKIPPAGWAGWRTRLRRGRGCDRNARRLVQNERTRIAGPAVGRLSGGLSGRAPPTHLGRGAPPTFPCVAI